MTPTIFIIFGATGDLFQRKILPALQSLRVKGLLPKRFAIVAYGRRALDDPGFRTFVEHAVSSVDDDFLSHLTYVRGEFADKEGYARLKFHCDGIDSRFGQCTNKLFYCAVPPEHYSSIFKGLALSGLTIPCSEETGWTRILVEKPFGKDIATARALDRDLGRSFKETQIFRIDHYLAKETIRNILTFRASNPLFQSAWSREHVKEVEITLFERLDVSGRADFYDGVGALRDVGQNHLLQMLALISMELPSDLTTSTSSSLIRAARAKALSAVRPSSSAADYLRGQYEGFRSERGVAKDSDTETFFSLVAEVRTSRFKGVPFRISSGKALHAGIAEIKVVFKNTIDQQVNTLTFRIQPHEAITLSMQMKKPGFDFETITTPLSFEYAGLPQHRISEAYEKVLFDAIVGDQTLFASTPEVEAGWNFVTAASGYMKKNPLVVYQKGSTPADIIEDSIAIKTSA